MQEGARRLLQDPITFVIHFQILRTERTDFHAQRLRNPVDVAGFEDGAGCFAAMGTIQAIHLSEYFFVSLMECGVQITRRLATPTLE